MALLFGFLAFRKNLPMIPVAIVSVLLLAGSVWASFYVGVNLPPLVWVGVIALYLLLASLTPVWALLQPRDFLCACLAGGVMLLGVVGLIGAALGGKVQMTLPAITDTGRYLPIYHTLLLMPGGMIVGYHALIASGTTAKQLANEKHARRVSMGAMLLNILLAVVAVLAVSLFAPSGRPDLLSSGSSMSYFTLMNMLSAENTLSLTMAVNFVDGLEKAWSAFFGGSGEAAFGFFSQLAVIALAVFALTTLDTCARLARYLFAELFNPEGKRLKKLEGAQRFFATPVVGTLIVVVLGCALAIGTYVEDITDFYYSDILWNTETLWWFFGAANLLLAAMALMSLSLWLKQNGKASWMLQAPGLVCLLVALYDLIRRLFGLVAVALHGSAGWLQYLTAALSLVLLVLAVLLLVQLLPRLWKKEKAQQEEASGDVD